MPSTIVNIIQAADGMSIPTIIEINSITYLCMSNSLLAGQPNLVADGLTHHWIGSITNDFTGLPACTATVTYEVRNHTAVNVLFGVANADTLLLHFLVNNPPSPNSFSLNNPSGYIVLKPQQIATFTMADIKTGSIPVTVTQGAFCSRSWSSPQADGSSFTVQYLFGNQDLVNSYILTSFSDQSWLDSIITLLSTMGSGFSALGWSANTPTGVMSAMNGFNLVLPGNATIPPNANASFTFTVTADNPGIMDLTKFLSGMNMSISSSVFTFLFSQPLTITANICVAEGTLVSLANDIHVPVEQLRPGQWLAGHGNRPVRLAQVVRFDQPSSRFVEFERGSVTNVVPTTRFRVQPGHPLLVKGREVLPETMLGLPGVREVSLEQPLHVYTLITERRDFVLMQGMSVGTWSEIGWQNFLDNDPRAVGLTWSFLQ